MTDQTFNNLNVSNTINTTNLNSTNIYAENLSFDGDLMTTNINLTGKINNTTLQNLNSLDTTSSITSQFINAKNYTDNKINLLLSNPDVNINSISELYNILGNDPSLNVVNSLADKISKTEANQTISALNMNWANPIISSDFTIKNTDNSTQSVKTTINNNATNITNLTTNKLDKTEGILTDGRINGTGLYINNSSGSMNPLVANCGLACSQNGQRELDFCNLSNVNYGTGSRAFVFKKMNLSNVLEDLFRINSDGSALLTGNLTTGNISISTLNSNVNTNTTNITSNTSNINSINTNLTNNYFTKTDIQNNYFTITDIENNYFTKTFVNSAFYNKIEVDNKVDPINTSLTSLTNIIKIWNGNVGIGTSNPVNKFHVIGDTTMNGNARITQNLQANSITFDSGMNVQNTINTNTNNITTNTNNIATNTNDIATLMSFYKKFPKASYSSGTTMLFSTPSVGKYKPDKTIKIKIKNRTAGNGAMYLSQPITFKVNCFFYRSDVSNQGQCCFNLMLLPMFLNSWGVNFNTSYTYELNNSINGNSSFSYINSTYANQGRQYWTYNQDFTTTTGGAGIIYAENTMEDGFKVHTIHIIPLFNNESTYSLSIEAIDIYGATYLETSQYPNDNQVFDVSVSI